jgi:hypothetical protein
MKFRIIQLIVFLCLLLLINLNTSYAENFFDSQKLANRIIDGTLSEGMMTGHYGCVEKTIAYLSMVGKDKDEQSVYDKAAWYNAVNAHRMMDNIYHEIKSEKTKKQMFDNLKSLDSIVTSIGKKSFGWNVKTTKLMYQKTRELIEARIVDINKECFGIQ